MPIWTVALSLLCFVCSTAGAAEPWPKAMRDVVTGSCVINFGGESPSRKFLKSVRRTCECMTDGYEKVLDAKRVLEVTGLPPDKADAAPENAQMRVVIDACMRSTDLLGAAKEEAKQPISQKMREDFLVGCAMKEREKADDIEDGERKLADSCRCAIDAISKIEPTAEDIDVDEQIRGIVEACHAKHLK